MTIYTTFETLENILLKTGAQLTAPETHGLQMGLLCGRGSPGGSSFDWFSELLKELDCVKLSLTLKRELRELLQQTVDQIKKMDFEFDLLLPDDGVNLRVRTEALGEWCRGFLFGLALTGITNWWHNTSIVKEAVLDISNIADVATMTPEHNDQGIHIAEEESYHELVEFVKVAVQVIQLELCEDLESAESLPERVLH